MRPILAGRSSTTPPAAWTNGRSVSLSPTNRMNGQKAKTFLDFSDGLHEFQTDLELNFGLLLCYSLFDFFGVAFGFSGVPP